MRATALPQRPRRWVFGSLAFYSFVVLGLPDGTVGTAWPVLRKGFGAPLDALGVVLLVGTAGSVISSAAAGVAFARLGPRKTIMMAAAAGMAGASTAAVTPSFWAFALAGGFLGLAAGLIDSAVNTSVAETGRNRLLNMVHGAYGVGTTLAPLVVTLAVLAGSWRASYGVVFVAEVLLLAAWWLSGRREQHEAGGGTTERTTSLGSGGYSVGIDPPDDIDPLDERPPAGNPGGRPEQAGQPGGARAFHVGPPLSRVASVVGLGLFVFMIYTGLEVSAGQWSPSFDRAVLHMGAGATGVVTFGYWGALTAARFGLAVPKKPLAPKLVVRWGCVAALGGALLVWWRPVGFMAPVGLVLVGAALAGVFPALVALTPGRVGEQLAHHVIGWQIGAASVGGSAISALFGLVFQHGGLADLGPALVAVAILLVAGSLLLERVGC